MNSTRYYPSWLCALSGICLAGLLATSCVSGAKIRADAEVVKRDIAKARESGAYRCAPRDLAMAESHVHFCLDELDQGNWLRADEHVKIALASVKSAIENSKDCAPKKVLIKQPPKIVAIKKTDRDGDGIVDVDDKCPDVPGLPEYQGCPPSDADGDGILDNVDKCPNDPEDKDQFEDEDGCPDFDNDQDGIPDLEDKCPNDPEDKDDFQDEDGCPDPDNDGDGIADTEDKCPNEPGPPDSPQGKGCPRKYTLVKIDREKKRIEIKQKVHFQTAKWRILPRSYGLLNQVAQVLKDYPKMKISIDGHTDNRGSDRYNQRLSENRAGSVRKYLIGKGIDASRMRSIGHGEGKPIASNRTRRGRAANRRVEFNILEE